jgi:hypothetical protein
MAHELTILIGGAIPLVALLICWAAGLTLTGAVRVASWTSAAMVVITEAAVHRFYLSARVAADSGRLLGSEDRERAGQPRFPRGCSPRGRARGACAC